jgi:hypothetical protein
MLLLGFGGLGRAGYRASRKAAAAGWRRVRAILLADHTGRRLFKPAEKTGQPAVGAIEVGGCDLHGGDCSPAPLEASGSTVATHPFSFTCAVRREERCEAHNSLERIANTGHLGCPERGDR